MKWIFFPHQSHNDNNYDEIIENIKISETKKIKCITNKKSQKTFIDKIDKFLEDPSVRIVEKELLSYLKSSANRKSIESFEFPKEHNHYKQLIQELIEQITKLYKKINAIEGITVWIERFWWNSIWFQKKNNIFFLLSIVMN